MRKSLILAILLILGGFGGYGSVYGDGWFHPFRHRQCVQPQVQVYNQWSQYGIFKAHFGEDTDCPFHKNRCHSDHWVYGYVGNNGFYDSAGYFHPWIYYEKEVNDPFHPGVGEDVEQIFKDLENDVLGLFTKHHNRVVGPKVENK